MAKFRPLLKLVVYLVVGFLSIPVLCGLLVAVAWIGDKLSGSHAYITYTGSVAREYEDNRPGVGCDDYGETARARIYINEGGGHLYAEGYMAISLPINPSIGVFPFFESGTPPEGIMPDENDYGIYGWLYGDDHSLEIGYSNLREGTITLESIQSGYYKRLKGHFEATFEDKTRDASVILKGSFDIATRSKESYCLR